MSFFTTLLRGKKMKVKQTVSTKYGDLYIGWSNLQFTDSVGNEVHIDITDDQILEVARILNEKSQSILEKRAEKESEIE